ncbi:hypothetical protein RIF29_37473 [Crotalaria pallida]|uniref:Late embryogenesis abundant protein LEA-2 subgroup domain-containing protein n=1 Tax=Crotalaria pallida TaxID=3830 RepID=A0AAN9EEF3_CROPI
MSHQKYDQKFALYKPKHDEQSISKCFVFFFAAFVILCAILLISACIFRVRSPEVKLTSATFNQISYNNNNNSSPYASFNATLISHLSISNPNFGGDFSYENSKMSVLYEGVSFGDRVISNDTLKARETRGRNVSINVRSVGKLLNLTSHINSGMLNLTSYAKFSGTVQVLKIINKRKIIEMVCSMNLNLTSHTVQGIQC